MNTKHYGDIEICATCATGQLTRLRDGMIRKHKREIWENGEWAGGYETCPGSGQPHVDLVAENNARATKTGNNERQTLESLATTMCKHGTKARHDVTGDPIAACAAPHHGNREWGAFNDEGCFYAYDCAVDVANEAAKENQAADSDPDDPDVTWGLVCAEHDGQQTAACTGCNA